MSSTNKTTNYELSQFLGTDKPAWLSDYNSDMSKIDTQMKANADGVTTATNKADTAQSDATTALNNAGTAQNTANTANTTANNAQTTANTANGKADANALAIQALQEYLDLEGVPNNLTISTNLGTINSEIRTVRAAKNSAGTLGKIYGEFRIENPNLVQGQATVTLSGANFTPSSEITVDSLATRVVYTSGGINYVRQTPVIFKTNGDVEIKLNLNNSITHMDVQIIPALIFLKNFGD